MKSYVKVNFPASCGELVQGVWESEIFLSSYAINLYNEIEIYQSDYPVKNCIPLKTKYLILDCMKSLGRNFIELSKIKINIKNPIPYEKGMGSSTADLAGMLYALYTFFEEDINLSNFAQLASNIEPTDSLIYPSLSLMNPDTGFLYAKLDNNLNDSVICLELADKLNTIAYRKILLGYKDNAYKNLFQESIQAFTNHSLEHLLDLTSQSAKINQKYNPKPYYKEIADLINISGVKAINISHTGTVVGIVYSENIISTDEIIARIQQIDKKKIYQIRTHQIVSSEPKIETRN
ncbi:GHMP family kinase ATP-binding protein [Ignavigranum ruoffiae]|uniref:Threonine kinase n=1 Tax=Ignavigranum ruoffiae TaxID=89093 RepID=A0A1H9CHF6_9LACT|nr:hypothetical protein [Ignavigranum ruoffiae]SEQ00646.1 threonine kinase [Ignavigranum ruoffiae]